jgi:hypothetical protein
MFLGQSWIGILTGPLGQNFFFYLPHILPPVPRNSHFNRVTKYQHLPRDLWVTEWCFSTGLD